MAKNFKQRLLRHFTLLNLALGLPLLLCIYALGSSIPRTIIDMANITTAANIAENLSTNLALGRITLNAKYSSQGHQLQTQPVFYPLASKAREALVKRVRNNLLKQLFEWHIATNIQLILSPESAPSETQPQFYGTVVAALDNQQIGQSFQYLLYDDDNIHSRLKTTITGQNNTGEVRYRSGFAPVFNANGESVAMVVVHSDASIVTRFNIYSGLFTLLLVATMVGLSLFFATKIAGHLHTPIKELHDGMVAFSKGDFSVILSSPHTGDEMDGLIQHFNNTSEQLHERLQMLQAMEMAAEIQTKLLPSEMPEIHRYDIAVSLQYAELAGGDYYDFIHLAFTDQVSSKWLMVIGDVTGHGVSAALLVAWLRATVRAHARDCHDNLQQLIAKLNASMLQDMNTGKFVTLFLAVVDANSNQISWISAGHDPARLYKEGQPISLLEACGPPVGVITNAQWNRPPLLTLTDNDRLLIVTDGLQDAKDANGSRLGIEPVDARLKGAMKVSAKSIKQQLTDDLNQHVQQTPLADDVTFMVIKREA